MAKTLYHPHEPVLLECPACGLGLQPPTPHSCGSGKETEMRAPSTGAQPDILDEESDRAYAEALSEWDDLTKDEQDALRTSTPSYNHERKTSNMPATTATKTAARKGIRIIKSPRLEAEAQEHLLDDATALCGGDREEARELIPFVEALSKLGPERWPFLIWQTRIMNEVEDGAPLTSIARAAAWKGLQAETDAEYRQSNRQMRAIYQAEIAAGQQGR